MNDEKQWIRSFYDRVEPSEEFEQKLLALARQPRRKAPARLKPLAAAAVMVLLSLAGFGCETKIFLIISCVLIIYF